MSRRNIPDLRDNHDQITLDHCYVLIAELGRAFDVMEGYPPGTFKHLADEFEPTQVQTVLQKYFKAPEFSRLFNMPEGKWLLLGIFAKHLFDKKKSRKDDV